MNKTALFLAFNKGGVFFAKVRDLPMISHALFPQVGD